MKKFKKIFAAIAASALVAAMSFTSMAASITIKENTNQGVKKQTYKAYKILDVAKTASNDKFVTNDGNKGNGGTEGFSYTMDVNSVWKDALTSTNQNWLSYELSADKTKYVVELKATNNETTAKQMAKYFNDYIVAEQRKETPKNFSPVTISAGEDGKVEVNDGYYLITSTLGTNLILATSDIEITEKNEYPLDDKKVESVSVMTGKNATYYITVVVPETVNKTETIKVHDTVAGPNLKFNNDVMVYVGKDVSIDTAVNELKNKTYNQLTNTGIDVDAPKAGCTDHCTFEININQTEAKNYAGQTLVFRYSAEALESATKATPMQNTEHITYADYESQPKSVDVMTYGFKLTKNFKDSKPEESDLAARFKLYTEDEYKKLGTENKDKAETIKLNEDNSNYVISKNGTNETISAKKNVETNITGLKEGTYYLVETSTAKGYNVLDHAIKIIVTPTVVDKKVVGGEVKLINGSVESKDAIKVTNERGILLPSTGGMGTTVFAIVGLLVMAGAAVTLIVKKRA